MTEHPCSCGLGRPSNGPFCRNCFRVWYDSGIQFADHLAAECKARKDGGFWPWGAANMPSAQINEIAEQFVHGGDE